MSRRVERSAAGASILPLVDDSDFDVSDPVVVRTRHIVNRWVFLPHQRPLALREIEELIAFATALPRAKP
jgi:hypothetical protein